jgi:hypothetical protein
MGKCLKMLIMCLFILLSCNRNTDLQRQPINIQPTQEELAPAITVDLMQITNANFREIRDAQFWTEDKQMDIYIHFFYDNNIEAVLEFRRYMEDLDREIAESSGWGINSFSTNYPRPHLINPVILLIGTTIFDHNTDRFLNMEILYSIYNEQPDLFFQGNRESPYHSGDMFSHPPLVHAIKNNNLEVVAFFVENVSDWKEMRSLNNWDFDQMVMWDIGLGGNLLSYLPEQRSWNKESRSRLYNFLVEQGVEEYTDVSGNPISVSSSLEETNVWSEPNINSEIIRRIGTEDEIKAIKVTTYIIDNYRWINFEMEDKMTGWAPINSNIWFEIDY